MRVGYLGPAGTFSEEAARRAPPRREREAVPFASIHDTVLAVERGDVDRALVPIENSLEGGVNATLDALAFDAPDAVIVGEARARHPPLPDRARGARARGDRGGRLAPAAAGAVRALPAHRAARRRGARRRLDRRGGARPSAERDEPWAALGPRGAAERYGCERPARGDRGRARQRDALRLARRRPAATPRRAPTAPAPGRPRSSSPAPATLARLARALPVGVRLPRREPHEDRVAARARAPRPLPVPRRPRGPRPTSRGRRRDRRPARRTARTSACSAPIRPPDREPDPRRARLVYTSAADSPWAASRHQADWGPRRLTEHRRRGRDGGRVLVLNATFEPINVCTVRRAAVLLLKEQGRDPRARARGSCAPSTRRCRGRSSSAS